MGFNVPVINRDSELLKQQIKSWVEEPQHQKKLVLVIVSVALLLDNMLYMVIVPIIPKYLRDIHAYDVEFYGYHNETVKLPNGTWIVKAVGAKVDYKDEELALGWLFASKAMLQIFINPLSGYIIDRVGYEIPMIVGLTVMFSSTAIFALGRSYSVLFFARSLQVGCVLFPLVLVQPGSPPKFLCPSVFDPILRRGQLDTFCGVARAPLN